MLLVEVEHRKDNALLEALNIVKSKREDTYPTQQADQENIAPLQDCSSGDTIPPHPEPKIPTTLPSDQGLSPGECARILQQLCPLCFGGNMFGRPVEDGADIHVSIDGNFNHRHARAAGDCPEFHQPRHLRSKEEVDRRGAHIEKARLAGKPLKRKGNTQILDEAVDACEEAHESGSGSKIKTNLDKFDHGGVMGMTCRHDRPLFLANIDTPGEQQKFGVALIEHLFQYLPHQATVIAAYDVGCVSDRSRQLWACQVVYAPRMRKGMGLTDGEGIERLWSRIRRLIPITRNASMQYSQDFVREQWRHQQATQLSHKSHAPVRVKKELDLVLGLQAEIDSTQKTIESARKALEVKDGVKSTTSSILAELDKQQQNLATRVEELYASVNVSDAFPELKGPQLKLVHGLLMARDMKINIQKRAIGNFFEWDRLKQASGGRDEPLGTKLHQKARANIQKHVPALTNAIKCFNKKIDHLSSLYQPEWNLPLPAKLPTDLGRLKDDPNLLTDVWISTSAEEVPLWLSDPELREAIAVMHSNDRCSEEQIRVGQEADNLRRWFRNEFLAVHVALLRETSSSISFVLTRYRNSLHVLTSRWRGNIIPGHLLKFWEDTSENEACRLLKIEPRPREYVFMDPVVAEPPTEPEDVPTDVEGDEWSVAVQVSADDVLMDDFLSDNGDIDEEEFLTAEAEQQPEDTLADHVVAESSRSGGLKSDFEVSEPSRPQMNSLDQTLQHLQLPLVFLNNEPLASITTDDMLLFRLAFKYDGPPRPSDNHTRVLTLDGVQYHWGASDVARLRSPTAQLNSACMNSGAALLRAILSASPSTSMSSAKCCIFSTFDLSMVRDGSLSDAIWRRTRTSEYWTKAIWIIPIHRTLPYEHWVLAIVQLTTGKIFLFDSLAETRHWLNDIEAPITENNSGTQYPLTFLGTFGCYVRTRDTRARESEAKRSARNSPGVLLVSGSDQVLGGGEGRRESRRDEHSSGPERATPRETGNRRSGQTGKRRRQARRQNLIYWSESG
ncbi:hypothetical protein BKA70DRAFT_1229224 [Coprinopsis sp. MPI-PUGE-AT-0042]|nr:hypothetical protein BKA70DRAFT_1229224 [Coprinopsis sp. MPI-PUGE-AT-0042]